MMRRSRSQRCTCKESTRVAYSFLMGWKVRKPNKNTPKVTKLFYERQWPSINPFTERFLSLSQACNVRGVSWTLAWMKTIAIAKWDKSGNQKLKISSFNTYLVYLGPYHHNQVLWSSPQPTNMHQEYCGTQLFCPIARSSILWCRIKLFR